MDQPVSHAAYLPPFDFRLPIPKRLRHLLGRSPSCEEMAGPNGLVDVPVGDTQGMRRAVAFCQVIDPKPDARTHKVSSKNIASMFQAVAEAYQDQEGLEPEVRFTCTADHVDTDVGRVGNFSTEVTDMRCDVGRTTIRKLLLPTPGTGADAALSGSGREY